MSNSVPMRHAANRKGNGIMYAGATVFVIGLFFILMASMTKGPYGDPVGSPGGLILLVVGLLFVVGGFARRVLAALER